MSSDRQKQSLSYQELFATEENDCFQTNDVFEYFQGILPESAKGDLEAHLAVCPSCATHLSELQQMERADSSTKLDSRESKRIFNQNLIKLRGMMDRQLGIQERTPSGIFDRFFQTFSLPAYANALAIFLLALLLYPAYKGFILDNEVSRLQHELTIAKSTNQPQDPSILKESYEKKMQALQQKERDLQQPMLSASQVFPARAERGDSQIIRVNFDKNHQSINLVFSVPPFEFRDCRLEIQQENHLLWQAVVLPQALNESSSELISVTLQANYFPEGNYTLKIFGDGEKGKALLTEYKLQIQNHS
jgi:hypothetical protein